VGESSEGLVHGFANFPFNRVAFDVGAIFGSNQKG
jgi:hypothetical protein